MSTHIKVWKRSIEFDYSKLSASERKYFRVMISGNVPYIRGVPGTAKSALGLSICSKIIWWYVGEEDKKYEGINYIDLRLADKDETDLGSYPVTKNPVEQLLKFSELLDRQYISPEDFNIIKDKYFSVLIKSDDVSGGFHDLTSLTFAVPDWALEANSYPTIIHVEELNRCDSKVRNASLQLLNEKQIGNFKFNNNVLWMASGNLGETDRTEVDEMDLALSNRICIFDHKLTVQEWCENFAFKNVWSYMVDYIIANPLEFYKPPAPNEIRYSTARSWTNLSNYIFSTFGDDPSINDVLFDEDTAEVALGFVGASWTGFGRYLTETSRININDIIDRLPEIRSEVEKLTRGRTMELMSNLRSVVLKGKNKEQMANIIDFLRILSPIQKTNDKSHSNDDEVTSYLLFLTDTMSKGDPEVDKYHKYIIQKFSEKAFDMQKLVNNNRHKDSSK